MTTDQGCGSPVRFDLFELDTNACVLRRGGMLVDLPRQPLRVLALLAARPNELVTRDEIKSVLWPDEVHGDFDGRLNFAVKRLREALDDDAEKPRYVRTVRNAGYMFIAPIRLRDVSASVGIPLPATLAKEVPGDPSHRTRWALAPTLIGFALVLCGFFTGDYLLWHRARGPVAQVSLSGSAMVARNAGGAVLWTYDVGQPMPKQDYPGRIAIADLGAGRLGDVLAVPAFAEANPGASSSDTLFNLSPTGKLRWRHVFEGSPRFAGHEYGPPWEGGPLMVTSDGDRTSIWIAAREVYSSPSALTEFDRDGHQLAEFVNWGHIGALGHLHNARGGFVLAGGISNQCDCAMLAVLREEAASGSSTARDPALTCENCGDGRPYRYLLFPRSELTQLSGVAYNIVKLIHVEGSRVWLGVTETRNGAVPGPDWIKYDLSDDFTPKTFVISDHFWTFHRQMEAEGKIHHTVDQCPERTRARKVTMWSAERGWEQIMVPRSTER